MDGVGCCGGALSPSRFTAAHKHYSRSSLLTSTALRAVNMAASQGFGLAAGLWVLVGVIVVVGRGGGGGSLRTN